MTLWRHRHNLLLIATCAATHLSAANAASSADLILDTFDDKNIADNDPGTWIRYFDPGVDLSSGDLRLTSDDCCRGIAYVESITGDVSVRTQFRVSSGIAGLAAKYGGGSGDDGYFAWITPDGNLGSLVRVNNVEFDLDTVAVPIAVGAENDFVFQMDVSHDTLTAWYWPESGPAPAAPQLSVALNDQMFIEGGVAGVYVGDDSQFSDITFRFIQIAEGPIAIPEPASLRGDFNANGLVEQADLDLVLLNWGNELADTASLGWLNDLPIGSIDQAELDAVLLNWGVSAGIGGFAGTQSIPEPATGLLLVLSIGLWCISRRWVSVNT